MPLYYGEVTQIDKPTDPGYGQGHPKPPIATLPLPPVPPGIAAPPIELPPEISLPPMVTPPIVIPEPDPPGKPLPPPGTIWPPLPPGTGIAGKALVAIWVVGVGTRWLVVEGTDIWPPKPPGPQPK